MYLTLVGGCLTLTLVCLTQESYGWCVRLTPGFACRCGVLEATGYEPEEKEIDAKMVGGMEARNLLSLSVASLSRCGALEHLSQAAAVA